MKRILRAICFIFFLSGVAILFAISFGFIGPTIKHLAMALMVCLTGGIFWISEEIEKK